MLFKAMIMCEECGEIHAERWLESANRHATTTTLFVLCESCKMNEFMPVDSFLFADDECKECGCFDHQHHVGCSEDFDPFATDFVPHHSDCQCDNCKPSDFIELDNNGNPMPIDVDPFDYDDDRIESTSDASSCVKHKRFEDPYAGCPECNKEQ